MYLECHSIMDISHLNEQQREVVLHGDDPLLVIAAAGTGKTETLTTRIAHLIRVLNVHPSNIMAVTFTNKAANEMRQRACRLAGLTGDELMIGTFHGVCLRILRSMSPCPKLRSLSVMSQQDAHRLMKECSDSLSIEIDLATTSKTLDEWRNDGISPEHAPRRTEPNASIAKVYTEYRSTCVEGGVTDFADILMHVVELGRANLDFRDALQSRWTHIFVDEFQDTNIVQLELIKMIAAGGAHVTVVGDDAQAIHEWRGAKVDNILRFGTHFHGAVQKVLEVNYRSVRTILAAADNVIKNNPTRFNKQFECTKENGENVQIVVYNNEDEEANGVVAQIARMGQPFSNHVILYRINAQSQRLEGSLRAAGIPYRIVGNTGFFERKEIKDAISYLRLSVNPTSKVDFLRVVNTPCRGIGSKTVGKIVDIAEANGSNFIEALRNYAATPKLRKGLRIGLLSFLDVVELRLNHIKLPNNMLDNGVTTDIYRIIHGSGLMENVQDDFQRAENIRHLVKMATSYEMSNPGGSIAEFMSSIVLSETSMQEEEDELADRVTLMTMHASKGLEFEDVHIIGMAEDVMPFKLALREGRIEEERRLAYVAITRAKQRLTLSYPEKRFLFGTIVSSSPSRFLKELELI